MNVQYCSPQTMTEALHVVAENSDYKLLAGGTDLVPRLNLKQLKDVHGLIYLGNISDMKKISDYDDHVFIGALTTHDQISHSEILKENYYNVWYASRNMGTPAIRNVATIGGNLVNASPSADGSLSVLASNAKLLIKSTSEDKVIGISDFFKGSGQTVLQGSEILYGILLPKLEVGLRKGSSYQRLGVLNGASVAWASAAVEVEMDQTGVCRAARIAVGAMAPTPVRFSTIEQSLVGQQVSRQLVDNIFSGIDEFIAPIDDTYATAWYRRKMIKVLLARALAEATGLMIREEA